MRLTLAGGSTDLQAYSSKYGGFVITSALNRYIYVFVKDKFEETIRVSYSITEIEKIVDNIKHPVVREALKLLNLKSHLEIVSMADMPAETGLGSSGSFTVGLLNSLHTFKDEHIPRLSLAQEATNLVMNILKEPCGCQDTYIASFGGFICLEISKDGNVNISPLKISYDTVRELESDLLFFYTKQKRNANIVLSKQNQNIEVNPEPMHNIKFIGYQIKKALEKGDLMEFGRLQNQHWWAKKEANNNVSNPEIDRLYSLGIKSGAIGGKLCGAGGGGFLMFVCTEKEALRKAMAKEDLQEVGLNFEPNGSKVLMNV